MFSEDPVKTAMFTCASIWFLNVEKPNRLTPNENITVISRLFFLNTIPPFELEKRKVRGSKPPIVDVLRRRGTRFFIVYRC